MTRQELSGTNVDSTAVDPLPCRPRYLHWLSCRSATDTTHGSSANILISLVSCGYGVSFGRDCWLHKRQDSFDDLKSFS